jgi:hypothetical protein
MINKDLYTVLTTFGGGKWMSLGDSVQILSIKDKKFSIEKYKKLIRRCLEYGWIGCQKSGLPVFAYKNMFGITKRGSDALEFFKSMRYHHTDRRILLSKEGRAMITLPK